MEIKATLDENWEKFRDWLIEQEWFQQLKAKWDELDPQSQFYAKIGLVAGAVIALLAVVTSALWSVKSVENELHEKQALLSQLKNANEEIHRLDEQGGRPSTSTTEEKPNWSGYLDGLASTAGLDKGAYEIGAEKPGASTDLAKEAMIDLKLKHVAITQVVKLALAIETGAKPMKLRALDIDTKADPEGYMDATLALSGFTLVAAK